MVRLTRVLVPTDFSDPARLALDYGRALARTFGATLHVIYVADQLSALMLPPVTGATPAVGSLQQQMEASARESLEALLDDDDRVGLHARTALLTASAPASAIVDYAREQQIDLIVMGTHGRSGVAHALLGSVTEKVVRTAPCPVLSVRPSEREFVHPDALQRVAGA